MAMTTSNLPASDADGAELTREFTNAEKFFQYFQHEISSLQDQLNVLPTQSAAERTDAAEHCQARISQLSDAVRDAASIIPAYDQRTYGEAIKALREKLQAVRATGKPKFSFRSSGGGGLGAKFAGARKGGLAGIGEKGGKQGGEKGGDVRSPIAADPKAEATLSITDHEGVHIIRPPSSATSSGVLANLQGCVIDLSSSQTSTTGLTVKHVRRCLVVAGTVAGPIHLTDIQDSVIVVDCRQFRMHESRGTEVYLRCASRPIIEDCRDIGFAPMTGGDGGLWDQVDDFKWLKSEQSPNWRVLGEEERVGEDVWRETVPGGPGIGVGDVLSAVGIGKV